MWLVTICFAGCFPPAVPAERRARSQRSDRTGSARSDVSKCASPPGYRPGVRKSFGEILISPRVCPRERTRVAAPYLFHDSVSQFHRYGSLRRAHDARRRRRRHDGPGYRGIASESGKKIFFAILNGANVRRARPVVVAGNNRVHGVLGDPSSSSFGARARHRRLGANCKFTHVRMLYILIVLLVSRGGGTFGSLS